MQSMTETEWRAFIQEGSKTGKLSTINHDGRPHCMPVWCGFDGSLIYFMTWASSQKAKNIRRDAQVTLTFDTEAFPYDFVSVEAIATIKELPLDELISVSREIAARYVPADRVEEFAQRNAVEGEVVVYLEPNKVLSAKGVAN